MYFFIFFTCTKKSLSNYRAIKLQNSTSYRYRDNIKAKQKGFNHLPGDLWAVAALPDNDSFSFSASSSFSSLFITIEMIINMKTRIPATQPIIMLILLLSMNRILFGSTGVLISVHLLDFEPKIKGCLKKWTEHFT